MPENNAANGGLTFLAPVSGIVMPITDVPDPTFAEKMLGDGIAVDPTGELLVAPVAGTVTNLHKSHHALTLTTAEGCEVLMHIGLETVLLKGQGFTPRIKEGDRVKTGDPLIAFDANYLVKNAASLLVMSVFTSGGEVSPLANPELQVEAGKTPIAEIILAKSGTAAVAAAGAAAAGAAKTSAPMVIRNPVGFHARPAAVLANGAKQFASDIKINKNGNTANAKSVVAIMGLQVEHNDTVTLTANGPDADAALAKLVPLIEGGLGESLTGPPPKPAAPLPKTPPKPVSTDPKRLLGVSASPGIAAGRVFQLRTADLAVEEKGKGAAVEKDSLLAALRESKEELSKLQADLKSRADAGKAAIFSAHQEILEDPEILDAAQKGITYGESAAFAWKKAFNHQAETLAKLNNELLAGRANDIRDVGRRVLGHLTGSAGKGPAIPSGVILVAENLTPSDTAGLDKAKVLGFATTGGGATSHVSILARAAAIPAVAAIEDRALEIPDGTMVILDGAKGEIRLNPSPEEIARVQTLRDRASLRRKDELRDANLPAETRDGRRMRVVGNISGAAEAREIPGLGGEGVGLLRSEFLFLQREAAPNVEEQAAVYTTIAKAFGPDRDLVVRTLDVGGDKPLSYFPLPPEDNPFLGVRGIRLNLVDADLLTNQVRAILAAAPFSKLHIMFPMVATVEELRGAKEVVLREKQALGISAEVKIGIMVEVPSAAIMAEELAREADFFSIGTNDLTQYTLAMDRGNARLAKFADAMHPAVLNLIAMTVRGAHRHGKWVGICGGLASEVVAVPILLGLGVDELSVTVQSIPAIKAAVRAHSRAECEDLAGKALALLTAGEVRELAGKFSDAE